MAPENLTRILTSGEINEANRGQTGGKAYALAHGMRLFGQFYNDSHRPADPYEFMELLRPDRLTGDFL